MYICQLYCKRNSICISPLIVFQNIGTQIFILYSINIALSAAIAAVPRPVLPAWSPPETGHECASEVFPPADVSRAVGWQIVDLDAPPEVRWTPLIKAKRTQMAALIAHIKKVRPLSFVY